MTFSLSFKVEITAPDSLGAHEIFDDLISFANDATNALESEESRITVFDPPYRQPVDNPANLSAAPSPAGLGAREADTVLAALRYWQDHRLRPEIGRDAQNLAFIDAIASRGDQQPALTFEEIDTLCDRIGEGPAALSPAFRDHLRAFADNADIDGRDVDQLREAIRTELDGRTAQPDFRALLAAILPYAESRAEDMDAEAGQCESAPSRELADKAIAAVDAAKVALDPLHIPTAADLRKSRLADAAEGMLAALERILEGSEVTGLWRDANGDECAEDADGATWEEYDGEEQDAWISTVAMIAREAIAKATGDEPADPILTGIDEHIADLKALDARDGITR